MISYAQNLEAVLLSRAFGGQMDGFYVDVGAGDPTYLSVTKWFYDLDFSSAVHDVDRVQHRAVECGRDRSGYRAQDHLWSGRS
jgi:hypothetical protein